jgi:hypothetical protein
MDVFTSIIWLSGFCTGCGVTVFVAALFIWAFSHDT